MELKYKGLITCDVMIDQNHDVIIAQVSRIATDFLKLSYVYESSILLLLANVTHQVQHSKGHTSLNVPGCSSLYHT